MKRYFWLVAVAISSGLGGCFGAPRLLNFPFDARGRSLNSPASELEPQVSGNFIVFVSDRNGSQDIYLYDAKALILINLPGLNALNEIVSQPMVSENGKYIVFLGSDRGRSRIYLYDRTTEQKRDLTKDIEVEVRNPTISADGSRIAFEAAKNGQWDILLCDRFGQILPIP
jgi:beta propeller repeat protein